MQQPSLFEMLTGHFSGGLPIDQVSEETSLALSVLDNIQRILNTRQGALRHLPDYGLPDMSQIISGLPGTSRRVVQVLQATLLKYEPRIESISLLHLEEDGFGHLAYTMEVVIAGQGTAHFGTDFFPDGRILLRHLKQQNLLE